MSEWEELSRDVIGEKHKVCGYSVGWWDEELREMVNDRCACHKWVLERNEEPWSKNCTKCKIFNEKIREKRRIKNESYMQHINESYWKIRVNFGSLFVRSKQSSGSEKEKEFLRDDTHNYRTGALLGAPRF